MRITIELTEYEYKLIRKLIRDGYVYYGRRAASGINTELHSKKFYDKLMDKFDG